MQEEICAPETVKARVFIKLVDSKGMPPTENNLKEIILELTSDIDLFFNYTARFGIQWSSRLTRDSFENLKNEQGLAVSFEEFLGELTTILNDMIADPQK